MAMIPENISEKIFNFGKKLIEEKNLYVKNKEFGRENIPHHITIRYGFTKDLNELEIRQLLKGYKPFTLEVIGMDKFDTHPNYDVVKFRVDSPVLKELHQVSGIYPNESDYPDYNPHMTLCYIKKNTFPFIKENIRIKIPIKQICYSPISGEKSYFEL